MPIRRKFKIKSPRVREEHKRENLDGFLYKQNVTRFLDTLDVLKANLIMPYEIKYKYAVLICVMHRNDKPQPTCDTPDNSNHDPWGVPPVVR